MKFLHNNELTNENQLDSLMGATIQRTRYSTSKKLILQDESPISETDSKEIKVISGLNLLTNNQVSKMCRSHIDDYLHEK